MSSALLDILGPRLLDEFRSRCAIVVNCAGPVTLLQDRVAQAAFRARMSRPGYFRKGEWRSLQNL